MQSCDNGGFRTLTYDIPVTSVPQLLALHDRNFIHQAYWSVLGRAADPSGETYYLARLRSGAHKLQILKQLRRSAEGRAFVPGVAGLDRAIKRHVWATRPIIGPIIRFFTGEEGDGAMHRQMRIVANVLGGMQADQASVPFELAALRMEQAALVAAFQGKGLDATVPRDRAQSDMSPPSPPPPLPPSLRLDPMPASLDSTERRILSSLRSFSSTRGAAA